MIDFKKVGTPPKNKINKKRKVGDEEAQEGNGSRRVEVGDKPGVLHLLLPLSLLQQQLESWERGFGGAGPNERRKEAGDGGRKED